MTRESKLGLLIGGALILLVCILVSDLVATSTNQTPAQLAHRLADDALTQIQNATAEGTVALSAMALDGNTRRPVHRANPVYEQDARTLALGDPQVIPPGAATRGSAASSAASSAPSTRGQVIPTLPADQAGPSASADTSGTSPTVLAFGERPNTGLNNLAGFNDPPLPRRVEIPQDPAGNISRGTQKVTVQKGDTLSSLAQKYLGSSRKWRELMAANKAQLKSDPRRLQAGMTLTIPALVSQADATTNATRRNAESSAAGSNTANQLASQSGPQSEPQSASLRGPKVVTIRSGETLADVARRELGSAGKWSAIYKANRSVIGDNPDIVQPGTKLVIPATRE